MMMERQAKIPRSANAMIVDLNICWFRGAKRGKKNERSTLQQHYTENDFGKFKTDSDEFDISTVKYFIVTIDYDLSDFGDEVFAALREG
jgi:hypothetical protein